MAIKRITKWIGCAILLSCLFLFFHTKLLRVISSEVDSGKKIEITLADEQKTDLIDVPLENQNTGKVPLENGCEITALSMLLNYYSYQTNKNDLANLLNYVPVYEDKDKNIRGNPHEGFVGNIYGGLEAMGVAVEPIAEVAEEVVEGSQNIVATSGTSFKELREVVATGAPVWVITTVDFELPTAEDQRTWKTTDGKITVSTLCHAVVITGVDDDYVYVNDPYGYKNRVVDRDLFETIYQKMGSQSLYLV